MKKVKVYNFFIFLLGLFSLTLGIALVVKSNLGISVAMSFPYVLSLGLTKLTLGQWSYIVQGLSLVVLFFIVKKLTVKHLMSFIVAFLFGLTLDMFNRLLVPFQVVTIMERTMVFVLGSIVISIGVAAFVKSNYPIMPFDTFVKEVSIEKNIKYSKFKTGFDLVCLTTSLISSFMFFRKIQGVHIGTFISAMVLGSSIGFCIDLMNRYIEGIDFLPQEKTKKVLELKLLNIEKSESAC